MKNKLLILFICVFFLGCLVPVVGLCAAGPADPAANEAPVTAPRLRRANGEFNEDFLSDLANYVGKGFWLRLECISGFNGLCAALFDSTVSEEVIVGEGDWLFYHTAADEVSGMTLLSEREIWCCARSLALMQEYAASEGAQFLFVAPNGKYDLYSENMVDYVTVKEGRNVDRLQELLDGMGVAYCDMYSLFMEQDEVLYWHGDSHWNGKGAALAADAMLEALGQQDRFFDGEFVQSELHQGDLYVMLYPTGADREPEYIPAEGFHFVYESNFRTVNDFSIETSSENGSGTLLMYRDSFGRNLYPYLAESFAQATFSRLNNYTLYRIPEMEADAVVVELGVKNLVYLLRYPAVYPSIEREASALEGLELTDCAVELLEQSEMEGYAQLSGSIDAETAVDSPILLRVDGRVFEAMPSETGFVAYVDSSLDLSGAEVYTVRK